MSFNRAHPSQTTPPVKKLFNEDNNKEKDDADRYTHQLIANTKL